MPETLELPLTVQKDVTSLDERVGALVVTNQDQYDGAAELLSANNKLKKAVKETFSDPKKTAKAAHASVCDAERKHLAPCETREDKIKGVMKIWFRAEEARVQIEEEAARKVQAKAEEDARLKAAGEKEAAGDNEGAEHELTKPVIAAPPPVLARPTAAKGAVQTKRLEYQVVDFPALVKAVATGTVPLNVLQVDKGQMQAHVRANKEELNFPGVRVHFTMGVTAR